MLPAGSSGEGITAFSAQGLRRHRPSGVAPCVGERAKKDAPPPDRAYNVGMLAKVVCGGALLVALAGQVQASFELVLVLDKGNGKVHRFDGKSGAYFGSFGTFTASARSMSIDQARNRVTVYDAGPGVGWITEWDYNTGDLMASYQGWNVGIRSYNVANDANLWIVGYLSFVEIWQKPDTSISFFSPAVGTVANVSRYAGEYVVFGDTGYRRVSAGYVPGASISVAGGSNFGATTASEYGAFAVSGRNSTNGGSLAQLTAGGLGAERTWSTSTLSGVVGVGPAHTGFYAVGKNAANLAQGRVTRMSIGRTTVSALNSFGEGVLVDPVAIQTVVAPEPASIGALGLGLALLARRRRRS